MDTGIEVASYTEQNVNILAIVNRSFEHYAMTIFNPRNNFCISKNDGLMNSSVNHQRDIIINSNTLMQLTREHYSAEQINKIKQLQSMEV